MAVIERIRHAHHDRQARSELATFAAQLPLSEEPVDWQTLRQDNPQFEDYLTTLESADSLLARALGRPQDVFYGTADDLRGYLVIERAGERPTHRHKVALMQQGASTSQEPSHRTEPFLSNVVQLTLGHIGADPELTAAVFEQAHHTYRNRNLHSRNFKYLPINDDWRLDWEQSREHGDNVTAIYLTPIYKPEYETGWEAKIFEGIAPDIAPDAVQEAVMQRAESYPYFGLVAVKIVAVPASDIRHDSIVNLLNQSGWRKPTGEEVGKEVPPDNRDSARYNTFLRHTDSDGTLPIVEVEKRGSIERMGQESTYIGAYPSDTMKRHFEQVVLDGMSQATSDVIRANFARAQEANKDRITLNASKLVYQAFEAMGYRKLEEYDFSTYGLQLAEVVVEQMIQMLSGMPQYQETAEKLRQIRELAKREDDPDKTGVSNYGWDPKKVSLVLPFQPSA
ncbi:hypothetical protein A3D80_02390 [Candidatus Roizmanbacteria bacterium RIFCSPHIGHO2_02_FULL_40_13b]|uniref:Uncharacterized protein n=1 Tax=Candidatus Roizmanbacteria bacterium RIFCSPHIGHO2_01_FULL_39_24 TaxID=1802032 RepID=A0A1F7GIT9_9BACT|nr:MAG: hypothetical protein A2799_01885 [Candidatus Roizmanbacteria bacterium RIFCSPHIGHO2_01_FULL_39_24]OGK26492.1 MAG: hypothetical protein A3D80_02390 [Candidatus Roizmanbacteria bacterium RIFCSPHIGHO2_02_FULL_40_13b]